MEQTIWWYFFLQRSIREAKKHNKIEIPMQIFTEDIACCDTPLYVTATNFDTVNDIISKLLPMIRKHNTEDYQLWFCPGPGKAPRLLQGHEYPHDIRMINIQKNFSSRDLRNFTAVPSLPGVIMKYLNADVHGKFILKPRNSTRSQQQKNMKEKTFKKQRTSITSWLDRGSVPHQDKVCTIPQVKKGGKLFGRELSSICQDGDLPSAILDMLYLLKKEGPTTKGVFIEPPSTTLFQTVKDKLDSGEEVDIEKQSVHVVAWIFKDFLQNIEGSLMTSKLYDEWIAVTEKVNDEEKLVAVQSLLDKMPPENAALLRQLFRILYEIKNNSAVNEMSSYHLSVGLAPCLLFVPSSCNNGMTNDISKKISLVKFMIENSPQFFGEDLAAVWHGASLYHRPGAKSLCPQSTPTNSGNVKETKHGLSSSPSGRTCTPGYNTLRRRSAALLPHEGIIDSQKHEVNVYTKPTVPSLNPPQAKQKCLFGKSLTSLFEDKKLPTPILDMLSIIAEKGHESDHIFKILPKESHWSLRYRLDSEQHIDWDEECVLVIASVLKDFIINIDGSLLTLEFYENWLTIPDEGTLAEKINAIQSLLQQIPEPNFILLKHLVYVLVIIKDSSMNNLNSYRLSLRIAPHVLWGKTSRDSLFGTDVLRKLSIMQIMIDNYHEIFGNDDMFIKHTDKESNDLRMNEESKSSSDKSPVMTNVIACCTGTTCDNNEKLNISCAALQEEGPPEKCEDNEYSNPPVRCLFPLRPAKKCLFGQPLTSIFEDKKIPTPIFDMLSIIAEKGKDTDHIFKTLSEYSHWSLRDKIDTYQYINWNEERVLVIASVLKDFITHIDGSLLTCELYESWLSVPDEGTLAEQINAIQRLLQKIPEPNFILLKHLICVLVIIKDSSTNKLDTNRLSLRLGPHLLWGWTSSDAFFGKNVSRKLSIIQIMIDNYHQIFGNDDMFIKHTDKESDDLKMNEESKSSSDKSPVMTNVIACCTGTTCDKNEKFNISYAALQVAGPTEKQKSNIYTKPPEYSNPTPSRKKCLFGKNLTSIYVDSKLPAPILEMLSIIAEKGKESDQIFAILPENSHWSLRERIESEELIDWNEEGILVIASVLKDFITNIEGSLLTSDLYESWLSVPDEGTLAGKINAIQRLLLKIPQANFILLKHLICVLVKIRDSSMNNLDSNNLSVRIAPYVLWNQTPKDTLFGSDVSRKMSIIQIMIDNYSQIFGNDSIFCKGIDKRPEDLKTCPDSINASGKSPIMNEFLGGRNRKTYDNSENFKISSIALQEEGPTGQDTKTATYKW
uniref:GTPase activating protein testicular GAP1 n=1 Tax=Rattus norvegicus TaxID=10116 RepID=Q5Y9B8_RAT|nr:GTPase activating protein testicular GAP1 [Rattus norvegicus]|eukprot:NP_001007636.2 GTPase activating protein testicular GAP1 [Rattus norvegicus]